jgi:hypothetical protein
VIYFYLIFLNLLLTLRVDDYDEANWEFETIKHKTRSPNYSDDDDDSKDSATIGPSKGKQAKVIEFLISIYIHLNINFAVINLRL